MRFWDLCDLQTASEVRYGLRFEICGPNYICYHVCLDCFDLLLNFDRKKKKKERKNPLTSTRPVGFAAGKKLVQIWVSEWVRIRAFDNPLPQASLSYLLIPVVRLPYLVHAASLVTAFAARHPQLKVKVNERSSLIFTQCTAQNALSKQVHWWEPTPSFFKYNKHFSLTRMAYLRKCSGDFFGKFFLLLLLIYFWTKVVASIGRLQKQGFSHIQTCHFFHHENLSILIAWVPHPIALVQNK